LLMNEHGDFFAGTPLAVLRHLRHRVRGAVYSGWSRVKDIHRGAWLWAFALIAQYSAPLSRWAFRTYVGRPPRSVAGLPAGLPERQDSPQKPARGSSTDQGV